MSPATRVNRSMKKIISPVVFGVALLLAGCGPPKPSEGQARGCPPNGTQVKIDNRSMVVSWKDDCNQTISGYNIYISPASMDTYGDTNEIPGRPFNDVVYAGDTDPDDPIIYYDVSGLDNDSPYQVTVRLVYPDRTLSPPSEPILTICGPTGEFEIQSRFSGKKDGFSLAKEEHVRADADDNDLYVYAKEGLFYIASPSRLDGFIRNNRLKKRSQDWDLLRVGLSRKGLGDLPNEDRLTIAEGDQIWMITPDAHHAQLTVLELSGAGDQFRARFRYTYLSFFALIQE